MDADDESIQLNEIGLSKGIIDFYNQINPIFDALLKYDFVDSFNEGFAVVLSNDKWNFINAKGQLLSEQWFDGVDDFYGGLSRVRLGDEWNFINTEGQLLSQQWFDGVGHFYNGAARVRINGKFNLIKADGQLFSKQWFDEIGHINKGFARVRLGDKCNFINMDGQFLSKQWFDYVGSFYNGDFAIVKLDGKDYTLDTKGNLTLRESRRSLSPIITESIIEKIKSECIKRIIAIK